MVAAIHWCFGFNGPLRQYFSLYRAVSQRVRKKREKIDERQKCPNNPHPHLLQVQKTLALLLSKLVGRFGSEYFPNIIAPPDHPLTTGLRRFCLSLSEIISSLGSLWCSGDSIKRFFDIFDINLKNKLKRKVKERKVKEGEKREKRHIVLGC